MNKYFYLGLLFALPATCAPADSSRAIYAIATVAGSASLGDGGPAIDAQVAAIQGVAADRSGNLYLSDTDHNCVRKIDPKGIITTVAGAGTAGFSGDGGPATAAQLNLPYGLAVDLNGFLYIADLGNNRVRRVSPQGAVTTVAGAGANTEINGSGDVATFNQLFGIAVDLGGTLFTADFSGETVRRIDRVITAGTN